MFFSFCMHASAFYPDPIQKTLLHTQHQTAESVTVAEPDNSPDDRTLISLSFFFITNHANKVITCKVSGLVVNNNAVSAIITE